MSSRRWFAGPASSVRVLLLGVLLTAHVGLLVMAAPAEAGKPQGGKPTTTTTAAPDPGGSGYVLHELSRPTRTEVRDAAGAWVATFTRGSRTVTLAGPARTLQEPGVTASVVSTTWVRVLPQAFDGAVDLAWLDSARSDRSPDVLQVSLQYVAGAPEVRSAEGLLVSDDASYGPLQDDGTRQEGSDWNDYQGVTVTYGTKVDAPEANQNGSLDCSGFMRMVWAIRTGLPLSLDSNPATLPRRAVQMYEQAMGTVVIPDRGTQVTKFGSLAPGDLVFFDASTDDGTDIDHVGMYLGRDTDGDHRFVSSRKSIDGPTMGDFRGRSELNGTGLYATSFRATRRL